MRECGKLQASKYPFAAPFPQHFRPIHLLFSLHNISGHALATTSLRQVDRDASKHKTAPVDTTNTANWLGGAEVTNLHRAQHSGIYCASAVVMYGWEEGSEDTSHTGAGIIRSCNPKLLARRSVSKSGPCVSVTVHKRRVLNKKVSDGTKK